MALNQLPFLLELFPHRIEAEIINMIEIVEQNMPDASPDEILDNVYNMLYVEVPADNSSVEQPVEENPHVNPFPQEIIQDDEEGAVGFGHNGTVLNTYFEQLQNMFPQASEDFLWKYCTDHKNNFQINQAIDDLTTNGYEPRITDMNFIWNTLKEALPSVDPSYLKKQAEQLVHEGPEAFQIFMESALDRDDLPTVDDYIKREQEEATLNMYRKDSFVVEEFLKQFPDPENDFRNRPNPLHQPNLPIEDLNHAMFFMYNKYPFITKRHINLVFQMKKKSLIKTCCYLDHHHKEMAKARKPVFLPVCKNVPLLQEVSYLRRKKLIAGIFRYKADVYRKFKEEARALGLLETCLICAEDELIPEECFSCSKGCIFCRDCIQKYVEVKMGEGCTTFGCCNDCDSEFTLRTLQLVLPENMFEKIVLKIQSDEVKRANVDGLETCPFCDFAGIPAEDSKIFECQNPDCLKPSCRLCRHDSHIPKRCNEIEYDEDVQRRTFIENVMTEARARTCYSCKRKFVKDNGCNKMACHCGALMCYQCSQPIKGYDHFGNGKCPLFCDDVAVDLVRVMNQAEKAKRELGNVQIKFDPTVDLQQFF